MLLDAYLDSKEVGGNVVVWEVRWGVSCVVFGLLAVLSSS